MKKVTQCLLLGLLMLGQAAHAAIQTREITYQSGAATMRGFLAWDDAIEGRRPGVLVVHEWWGQNAYARERAKQVAQLGYTALALDMYGDGKLATHPAEASALLDAVMGNAGLLRERFLAAQDLLKQQPGVDPDHIAAIGYCMGGAIVLQMAREGADLDIVASFHGALGAKSRARRGEVKAQVLVFNGESDPMVTPEQVAALREEMAAAGADFTYVGYPGAKHSFTNPEADALGRQFDLPLAYDAGADADSWGKLQAALKTAFARN